MGTCIECGKQTKGGLKYCYECWQKRQKPVTQLPLGVLGPEMDFEKSHKIADQVLDDINYNILKARDLPELTAEQKFQIGLEAARLTNYRVVAYRRFQAQRARWGHGNNGSR